MPCSLSAAASPAAGDGGPAAGREAPVIREAGGEGAEEASAVVSGPPSSVAARAAPHSGQKRHSRRMVSPHWAQSGRASAPQRAQKRRPRGTGSRQDGHGTTPVSAALVPQRGQ